MKWDQYAPFFTKAEFDCKHTGRNKMRPEFMDRLLDIRKTFGKPMVITSGYRDVTHPVEVRKTKAGEHTYGLAADIAVSGLDALDLIIIAYGYGIRRVGIGKNFIHLGLGDKDYHFPQSMWTY